MLFVFLGCGKELGRRGGRPGAGHSTGIKTHTFLVSCQFCHKSHYIEVTQGAIFMQQNMRFIGLMLGQLAMLKK